MRLPQSHLILNGGGSLGGITFYLNNGSPAGMGGSQNRMNWLSLSGIFSYYKLNSVLSTEDQLDDFLDNLLEDDLNEAILTLDRCFNQNHPLKEYFAKTANTHIKEDINTIIDNAYIFDYYIDLEEIVESSMDDDGNADLVFVENVIRDYILEELKSHLESTYENPYIKIDEILDIIHKHAFDEFGIEDEIEGYLNSKFKERSSYESERHTDQEIDVLFDSLIG